MDLKRIRTFVAVAELGSVSAAALKLNSTQPTLSRQLQELQEDIGIRLFDMIGRRLKLSTAGLELLPACRLLLNHAQDLQDQISMLKGSDAGVLRIGATPHSSANLFSGFLSKFAAIYPHVRIELVEAGSFVQLEMLRAGELNAMTTMRIHVGPGITGERLATSHAVAAFNPSNFDLRNGPVDVKTLNKASVLVLPKSFGTRYEFDAACQLAGIEPVIVHESAAPETLQALARVGHGIAILPTTAQLDTKNLKIQPLAFRGKLLEMDLMIYWSVHRPLPNYAKSLTNILSEHVRPILSRAGGFAKVIMNKN